MKQWKIMFMLAVVALVDSSSAQTGTGGSRAPDVTPVPKVATNLASNGKYDILALSSGQSLYVRLGNGDGTFSSATTLTTGTQSSIYYYDRSVVIADFNGDNKPDLAVCDAGAATISVFLGNGNGTFGTRNVVNVGTGPVAIASLDYNQDGRIDLAVVNKGSNSVSILRGNGSGGFTLAQTITVGTSPNGIALADLNDDGNQDIVVANAVSGTISIILGSSSGIFLTPTNVAPSNPRGTGLLSFLSIVIADFVNRDGLLDIAVCSRADNTVYIFTNKGSGVFSDSTRLVFTGIRSPVSIVARNFDNTNGPDLAIANGDTNTVTIRLNDGANFFQPPQTISIPVTYVNGGLDYADVDGNGYVDLIACSYASGNVSVLKNNGGVFTAYQTTFVGNQLSAVAIGDLNGDRSDIPAGQLGIDDNRLYDSGFGYSAGVNAKYGWFDQLTPASYPSSLKQVRVRFGDNINSGSQVRLVIYADPENNGPENGQASAYSQVVSVTRDADSWSTFSLTSTVSINSGSFVVGIIDNVGTGLAYPGTYNNPGLSSPAGSRAFETSDAGTTFISEFSRGNPDFQFSFLIRGVLGTVAALPTVTTSAATSVTSTAATLNGTANPNGDATTAWFEYGTSSTLATSTSTATQSIGSGSSAVSVTANLSSLSANTTYYVRVAAQNSAGIQRGTILSFQTTGTVSLPTVTTSAATSITTTGVTLNSTVNANSAATTAWFEYGTSSTLATSTSTTAQSAGSGTSATSFTQTVTSLTANTTYYFRVAAQNSAGIQRGSILSFQTSSATVTVSSYSFSASAGTFTALSGPTSPTLSGGTTDEGYYNSLPIGFTFTYLGSPYTTVSASTNGWLTLGQPIISPASNNDLASGGNRPVIAPLWDDLNLAQGSFSYSTQGSAGSRIFTAQWLNVLWNSFASLPVISFQVKLYESTGAIDFVYRQESGAVTGGSASIGITAGSLSTGNYLSLSGAGANPTTSSTSETNNVSAKPATGQVYSFQLPAVAAPAITVSTNSLSFGSVNIGGSSPLTFTVSNTGTATLTVSSLSSSSNAFTVNPSSFSIAAGGSAQTVTVTFSPAAATTYSGTLTLTHNAGTGTNTVNLSGTGTNAVAAIALSTNSISFGSVIVGTPNSLTFTVSNPGGAALSVSNITSSNGVFTVTPTVFTVQPGGTPQTVTTTFTPAFAGTQNGTLTILHNIAAVTTTVSLSGVGTATTSGLTTSIGRFSAGGGIPASEWVLMSVPYTMDNQSASALSSQLSGSNPWKMYGYSGGNSQDITNSGSAFQLGVGFWFKTVARNSSFNLNFGSGTVYAQSTYSVQLTTGWSLIGPPFYSNEATWSPVNTTAGSVGIRVWKYAHESNGWVGPLNPGVEPMKPFGGYAVYNQTGAAATFTFTRGAVSTKIAGEWEEGDGWYIKLNVGRAALRLGEHRLASVGTDAYDYPMPPSVPDATTQPSYLAGKLWSDIRPVGNNEVERWKIAVDPSVTTSLGIEEQYGIPTGWRIVAEGIPNLGTVDLLEGRSFSLPSGMTTPFTLTIIAGPSSKVELEITPTTFVLAQNYPNPFNPTTAISYRLVSEGEVSLKIYNVVGEEVALLVGGVQKPGSYEVRWDGNSSRGDHVASGIYFYVLKAGNNTASRKMLLLK